MNRNKILVQFMLYDIKTGERRNVWTKRFVSDKSAHTYFNKLEQSWKTERHAQMIFLS